MDFPVKPLIILLAIVNPIGVIPFCIHFTRKFSLEQPAWVGCAGEFGAGGAETVYYAAKKNRPDWPVFLCSFQLDVLSSAGPLGLNLR